jgi:hypothetical protein
MTLAELIAEVYSITNRPDLVAETAVAVRAATLEAHHSDFYYKDLFETGITFNEPDLYIQQIEYRTLLPRWRALKYLRKFDSTAYPPPGTPGTFFNILDPQQTLDSYGVTRENICYVAGDVIQVRSNTKLANALIGCYLHPIISPEADYNSWIALDSPYVIIFRAAASVFKIIGKDSERSAFQELWNVQMAELKMANIVASGY